MNIDNLVQRIEKANNDYFNGISKISDEEYDTLKDQLRELSPNHVLLTKVGALPTGRRKKLPVAMSSQEKVNSVGAAIEWVINKGVKNVAVQEKLDGMSFLAEYNDGNFIAAYSRGDGIIGEDITENFKMAKGFKPSVKDFSGYIKGELIILKSVFNKVLLGEYSNPRNATAGIIRKESGDEQKYLSIYCYDVIGADFVSETDKLEWLQTRGFFTPKCWIISSAEYFEKIEPISDALYRENLDYEIDGLVLKINDVKLQESFGRHGERETGNPRGQVAFKFAPEMRETTLLDIEWTLGLVGRITPVAIFEPVSFAGVTISRASLYNPAYIIQNNLTKGARVLISRRNDVIPRVERAITTTDVKFVIPSACPSCGNKVRMEGEALICGDSACMLLGDLQKWVTNFQIMNLGPQTLKALVSAKLLEDVADLYTLEDNLIHMSQLIGEKNSKKIISEISKSKSGNLHDMLGSLNIPLCGRRLFKRIIDSGFDTMEKIQSLSVNDLTSIPGIGRDRAVQILHGIESKSGTISKLFKNGWRYSISNPIDTGHAVYGKSFCFTGEMSRPRKELEKAVLERGGFLKTVSKELNFLVCADPSQASSKLEKAKKYNIKIISEDQFDALIQNEETKR